jgi:cyclophilin family peptidyl-prolyl cis-trans isomerase
VLALLAAGPARAADPGPTVQVPAGLPVGLDGLLAPSEWDDAVSLPLGEQAATLRIKQARGTLLLAIDTDRVWARGTHLMVNVCPDFLEANPLGSPGAVSLDYEPLEHNRPHLIVRRNGENGAEDLPDAVVVRARVHGKRPTLEVALRLPALGVTGKNPPARRIAVSLTRALEGGTPTWPPGLDIGAQVGTPAADFMNTTRWGRLTGWVNPDGPGAYSQTDWSAFLAEDRELTGKGARAHAKAFEIQEEGGSKLEKEDAVVEREVLEPLAWIAAKEPLSPYDVYVRCQVLRHLNRHGEALGGLDALAMVREGDYAFNAAHEKALVFQALERYEEAADLWTRLVDLSPTSDRQQFASVAAHAREQIKARDKERAERAKDAADPDLPRVEITTTRGTFVVRLHAKDVPQAVRHFLALAAQPAKDGRGFFYDGTLFQRVVGAGFAQGGDPRTKTGGCDADLSGPASATIPVEVDARHGFWRGAVGFARGTLLENASQFFVLTAPTEFGSSKYTCFGHVVTGMDVVDRLERCDTLTSVREVRGAPPAPASAPR